MTRAALLIALAALALPASAAAHATLLRTQPANGAVLARAPAAVVVSFDDQVRVASGNAAVENVSGSSVLGGPPVARGRALTLPLRRSLAQGAYSVRWSIVSDDGHREQGVLAFAVGTGSASPHAVLGASARLAWLDVVLRTLWFFGLLAGGGAAVFWLLARGALGARLVTPVAHLLFFSLLATFVGGSGILHGAIGGTRFVHVLDVALTVSLVGGAAAALAPTFPRLLALAATAALALLAAPTLSGHALDRDQPQLVSVPVDLAHMTAVAVWLGGLLSLVHVLPRAAADGEERSLVIARFSRTALVAVAVLALSGLGRSLTELSAVHQVWSTSYGRTLIVKTALFVPLLGLGWLNRTFLLQAFARLRRSALVELTLLLAIVVAVTVLTDLRPGKAVTPRSALAAQPLGASRPPALPPRDAVVAAREVGALGVAVARVPGSATVTLLGPDGAGADGRSVAIDGRAGRPCGPGCYRAAVGAGPVRVRVDGQTTTFDLPATAPDGGAVLQALTRAYRHAKTIVYEETLASGPSNAEVTRFTVVAPDRFSYATRGGTSGIVIGTRRWDRDHAGAPWVPSQQTRLTVTQPPWADVSNVHLVSRHVLTFVDRRIPAWFELTFDGDRSTRLRMTASAHFMVDRYVGFDVPAAVSPPSR